MYNAIPTIGARGIQFRSRIEAKWATVFDQLKFDWEYEPIDLKRYIPDFILQFGQDQVLVEIKSDLDIFNPEVYMPYYDKIVESGWQGNYIILGEK